MHIDLTQGVIKDHLFKLALPAVLGYLFHTIINITDTYFAGTISTQVLAALSLSASVFFMILAIAVGMSEAVTSLVGNALGEKRQEYAQHIALNAMFFAMILSLILSIIGVMATPYLVDALGDDSYKDASLTYMNWILYGAIFFVGSFFLNALLTAIGDTKTFRNVLMVMMFVNVILDYVFIELFEMGVHGIASATVIVEALSMLYLLYKVQKTPLWAGWKQYTFDKALLKKLLAQGFPPSMNMFMMAFGMYIITYFVAPFGKEAVGAFGIGMRIEQIFLMPVIGLNIATLAIVSQNSGAKSYERIRPTLTLAIRYGWIMSTLGVSVFLLFGEALAGLLTSDALVIKETALYLRISGLASYAFVVIFIYIAMLQGITKPAVIFPVSLYRQVIAPLVVFMGLRYFGFGITSIWVSLDMIIFSSALFLWWYGEQQLQTLMKP